MGARASEGGTPTISISIRQPCVEMILRGVKAAEYRSRPIKRRGRVYLYAAGKPGLLKHCERVGRIPSTSRPS